MFFKIGTSRIVLAIPYFGIVIKFPVINLYRAFFGWTIRFAISSSKLRKYLTDSPEVAYGFRWRIFRGILANQLERRLYKEIACISLAPTYFSLFGLLNVQAYAKDYVIDDDSNDFYAYWNTICVITDYEVLEDSHHFENTENLGIFQGRLVFRDYGSIKVAKIIKKYGAQITRAFETT